jgi:hypothetical protein
MTTRKLTRSAQNRLIDAFTGYREAFSAVQAALLNSESERLPVQVHALSQFPIEQIEPLDPDVARCEHQRRRWRAALHGLTELLALNIDEDAEEDELFQMEDPDLREFLEQAEEDETLGADGRARLDALITVVNAARLGGASYSNGTFKPVEKR